MGTHPRYMQEFFLGDGQGNALIIGRHHLTNNALQQRLAGDDGVMIDRGL
jgi:hypothetical protein